MTSRGHPARPRFGQQFEDLLTAAQAGAGWALERLWRELSPVVAGYLRVQGAAEPEEITSDTFLAAFTGLSSFQGGEAQFRSWIFTIAHNRLVDERRRRDRRPKAAGKGAVLAAERVAGGDVEHEALQSLSLERVRALCQHLSPDQRDVVLLRMVAGTSLEETAAMVGKSVGAVKALQHRAVDALRRHLVQVDSLDREKWNEGVSP